MHYLPFHPEDEKKASFCGTSKCWSWIWVSVILSVCIPVDVFVYATMYREAGPPLVREEKPKI